MEYMYYTFEMHWLWELNLKELKNIILYEKMFITNINENIYAFYEFIRMINFKRNK